MLVLTLGLKLRQKLSRRLGPKAHTIDLIHPIGLKYYLPNPTKFDTNFLPGTFYFLNLEKGVYYNRK
jgi:hypothetical protein